METPGFRFQLTVMLAYDDDDDDVDDDVDDDDDENIQYSSLIIFEFSKNKYKQTENFFPGGCE